jgi:hypothetical protein
LLIRANFPVPSTKTSRLRKVATGPRSILQFMARAPENYDQENYGRFLCQGQPRHYQLSGLQFPEIALHSQQTAQIAIAALRHAAEDARSKAVYLPLGFGVGAEIDCIPLEADDPSLPDLYHGLERHSDSVPDAVAWHSWKLLKEQPLQPGLSMPWIQTGYWVAIWAEAGPNIPNPHMVSNVRMMRIAHLRFQSDDQMVRHTYCRCRAFSTVIAIQAALERPCLRAVALSASTTSGASGTLIMTSNPLSRL